MSTGEKPDSLVACLFFLLLLILRRRRRPRRGLGLVPMIIMTAAAT
jgi:hypothetical protein